MQRKTRSEAMNEKKDASLGLKTKWWLRTGREIIKALVRIGLIAATK
jgi:hypothetical protein